MCLGYVLGPLDHVTSLQAATRWLSVIYQKLSLQVPSCYPGQSKQQRYSRKKCSIQSASQGKVTDRGHQFTSQFGSSNPMGYHPQGQQRSLDPLLRTRKSIWVETADDSPLLHYRYLPIHFRLLCWLLVILWLGYSHPCFTYTYLFHLEPCQWRLSLKLPPPTLIPTTIPIHGGVKLWNLNWNSHQLLIDIYNHSLHDNHINSFWAVFKMFVIFHPSNNENFWTRKGKSTFESSRLTFSSLEHTLALNPGIPPHDIRG